MIVYHGSDRYFRTLKISINLSRSEASLLNEGLGIYFSTDKNVASHYGKYLYTLELNSRAIKDFRKSTTIDMYIAKLVATVCNKFSIDLTAYINLGMLATNVYSGNISIDGLGREIILLLESNERFYNDTPAYKQSRLFSFLTVYNSKNLYAYLFNYNIKGIGIIKNVRPEIVKIVKTEKVVEHKQ